MATIQFLGPADPTTWRLPKEARTAKQAAETGRGCIGLRKSLSRGALGKPKVCQVKMNLGIVVLTETYHEQTWTKQLPAREFQIGRPRNLNANS
jgi:hypothetical protein